MSARDDAPRGALVLSEAASGLRHLRFAREVAASLVALDVHGDALDLDADTRALARSLGDAVLAQVAEAREHVKAYRDFKERERVEARALARLRPALGAAARPDVVRSLEAREAALEARLLALRASLGAAKAGLRGELERALGALAATHPELVPLVVPPLSRDRLAVRDDADPDDDAVSAD